jgi:hypothetical protein
MSDSDDVKLRLLSEYRVPSTLETQLRLIPKSRGDKPDPEGCYHKLPVSQTKQGLNGLVNGLPRLFRIMKIHGIRYVQETVGY